VDELNLAIPNVARMYDYYLGGKDNYAADREAAAKILHAAPFTPVLARHNRRFMGRAARHLAASGIRQFLGIGTGLPTRGTSTRSSGRWSRTRASSTWTTSRSA